MTQACRPKPRTQTDTTAEPIFQTDQVSLFQGDVIDIVRTIPPHSVDAVIADPPYCSGGNSTASRQADPANKYCQNGNTQGRPSFFGDMRDQRSFKYWCTLWLRECLRATKESGYCLIFIDWRQLPTMTDCIQAAGWTWRGVAAWDKGRGSRAPHKGFFRHQCEYIVVATNGKVEKLKDRGPFDGCYHFPVLQKDKHHMTGKPTDLLRELVKVAPQGGTVLDPFAGSSTTGVASLLEDRRFIGCEQSPAYCQISQERLAAAARGELLNASKAN